MEGNCAICGREETLTRHHLIPRTRHHNKRNKREFARDFVKQIVAICPPCHSQIHALLSEKELERGYNSVASIKAHAGVAKFASWIATKPRGFKAMTQRATSRKVA
ncbi:MAG: HNH endonuclease [Chthoniobacterales bacterium]|nr:HNH endonuclease [Chthoniobacterales bacterium]